jgi:hypothetical protein
MEPLDRGFLLRVGSKVEQLGDASFLEGLDPEIRCQDGSTFA